MLTTNGTRTCGPMRWIARQGATLAKTAMATMLAISFASTGSAQSSETVTLRFAGDKTVTGELLGFSDGLFRIQSSVGAVTIPSDGVECIGASCPEGTRLEVTGDRLVLTSKDGSVTLTGNLIEIVNNQYVLATDVGEVRIDINLVDCEGTGCVTVVSEPKTGGPVVLTGGPAPVEGILVEDLPDAYLVDVPNLGVVRISKDIYSCTGEGCP